MKNIRSPRATRPTPHSITLFDFNEYGQRAGAVVPCLGNRAVADTPHTIIATGFIPRKALVKGGRIRAGAQGTYVAGGVHPRIISDFALGPTASPTSIKPIGGSLRRGVLNVAVGGNGIEISNAVCGANALEKEAGETVNWHFDVHLFCRGDRVLGHGRASWGNFMTMAEGDRSTPSPIVQTTSDEYKEGVAYTTAGEVVRLHGKSYKSLAPITALENTDSIRPGVGEYWQIYWYSISDHMEFRYDVPMDLDQDEMAFSLRMGGPVQQAMNFTPPTFASVADSTLFSATGIGGVPETTGAVVDGLIYKARFDHLKEGAAFDSVAPSSTTGNRYWKRMSDYRDDVLTVTSAYAELVSPARRGLAF
jgi:hypothetical protein